MPHGGKDRFLATCMAVDFALHTTLKGEGNTEKYGDRIYALHLGDVKCWVLDILTGFTLYLVAMCRAWNSSRKRGFSWK